MELIMKLLIRCALSNLAFGLVSCTYTTVEFLPSSLTIQVGHSATANLTTSAVLNESAFLEFTYDIGAKISYNPANNLIKKLPNVTIPANSSFNLKIDLHAISAGHLNLGVNSSSAEFEDLDKSFIRLLLVNNNAIVIVSDVIGWMYFAAWSISFYPQVYENFRRRSVVGLNFDYLGLNLLGFFSYSAFNVALFWIPSVQHEYMDKHPRGIIPVELNDVIFALHALLLTIVTISQTLCFERGGQRVSRVCLGILGVASLFLAISLGLGLGHVIHWLLYLYFFSYVKLAVTVIKYIPQAWMNFRRKSTVGWSIGNVLLDCTGGSLSILQMFLVAYNHDDWSSIFGNPTKFGLGFFSILFDLLFITQHYCLYRERSKHGQYEPIPGSVNRPEQEVIA